MKKVLNKSALAALALTVSLGMSQVVSATPAASALKFLEGNKTVEESSMLYKSWSDNPKYQALLKAGDQAYKDLKQDTEEWARLKVLRCNALQNMEKLEQLLEDASTFTSRAKDVVTEHKALTGLKTVEEGKLTDSELALDQNVLIFEEDLKALEKALKDNQDASKHKPDEETNGILAKTYGELVEKSAQAFAEKLKDVLDDDYQEAVLYLVENFNEKVANKTTADIQTRYAEQKALVTFVEKIAEETGFSLKGGCAIGEEPDQKQESKVVESQRATTKAKDSVPNTGAHR